MIITGSLPAALTITMIRNIIRSYMWLSPANKGLTNRSISTQSNKSTFGRFDYELTSKL